MQNQEWKLIRKSEKYTKLGVANNYCVICTILAIDPPLYQAFTILSACLYTQVITIDIIAINVILKAALVLIRIIVPGTKGRI